MSHKFKRKKKIKGMYERYRMAEEAENQPPMRKLNLYLHAYQRYMLKKTKKRTGKLFATQVREALDLYFKQIGVLRDHDR